MFSLNPVGKAWFWLLILSIIGLILVFIFFELFGQLSPNNTTTPSWIWILFIVVVIIFIIAFILFIIDIIRYYRELEIAEACGELPPPCPKKIVCPRKCIKTEVVACPDKDRCGNPIVLGPPVIVERPPVVQPPCNQLVAQPVAQTIYEPIPITMLPPMQQPVIMPQPMVVQSPVPQPVFAQPPVTQPLTVQPIPGQDIPIEAISVSVPVGIPTIAVPKPLPCPEIPVPCPRITKVAVQPTIVAVNEVPPPVPVKITDVITIREKIPEVQRVTVREVQPSIMSTPRVYSVPEVPRRTVSVQEYQPDRIPVPLPGLPSMGVSSPVAAPQIGGVPPILAIPPQQVPLIPGPFPAISQLDAFR